MNFGYFKRLIDEKDPASLKRFVILMICFHFIITSFLVSFFVFYLIIYTPKGTVNVELLSLLKGIFEYDFYIMLSGLGIIGVTDVAAILLEKAKSIVAGNVAMNEQNPSTTTTTTLID